MIASETGRDCAVVTTLMTPAGRSASWRIRAKNSGVAKRVCDLTGPLGLTLPTVSHHLKILVDAGLLTRDKPDVWVYFTLAPGALQSLAAVLDSTSWRFGRSCRQHGRRPYPADAIQKIRVGQSAHATHVLVAGLISSRSVPMGRPHLLQTPSEPCARPVRALSASRDSLRRRLFWPSRSSRTELKGMPSGSCSSSSPPFARTARVVASSVSIARKPAETSWSTFCSLVRRSSTSAGRPTVGSFMASIIPESGVRPIHRCWPATPW
jgi:ArsR family transcriptional regulator